MEADVRFFCVLGPKSPTHPSWWPDIGYAYLSALREAGRKVRALTVGPNVLTISPRDPHWAHWLRLQDAFGGALAASYVNIVCAHAGLPLGQARTRRDMAPEQVLVPDGGGLLRMPIPDEVKPLARAAAAADEVIYVPQTALMALHVAGRLNVAITGTSPHPPAAAELEALRRYDAVVAPRREDMLGLRELGVDADHIPPADFAELLGRLEGYARAAKEAG